MSEMIEKVARAIWNVMPDGGRTLLPFGAHPETERCRKQARAALEAMRDPTDDMISTPETHWDYSCHVCGGLGDGWRSMIDTALK